MDLFQLWGTIGIKTADAMKAINEVEQKVGGLANKMGNSLQDAGNKMSAVGSSVSSAGQQMTTGITAPIAAIGLAAGKMAIDVENATANVAASLDVTKEEAKELSKSAQNVWKDGFGGSLEEVNAALINVKQNMKSLGASDDIEKVTQNAMVLAQTTESDINEVTRAAENLMNNFGVSSEKAFDMMAAGAKRGLNFSDEMFDNLAEYAPMFSAMGYSAEEMFGIMERGSKAGVYNLDYVNDVMKEFGIRIKDGSKSTNEAMSEMSADTQKLWQDMLAGKATSAEVSTAIVNDLMNMEDQVLAGQLGVALFGTKWEDLEADAMYAMLGTSKAMEGFNGTMEDTAATMEDTFAMKWQKFLRTAQSSLLPIGVILLDIANEWLPKIAAVVEKVAGAFQALPEGIQKFIVLGAVIAALAGPLVMVTGLMMSGIGSAVTGLGTMIKLVSTLSGAMGKLPKTVGAAASAMAGLGGGPDIDTGGSANSGDKDKDKGKDKDKSKGKKGSGKNLVSNVAKIGKNVGKVASRAMGGVMGIVARAGSALLPLLTNPWTLAVVAIVAIVAGLVFLVVKYWDEIKEGISKAMDAISEITKKVWKAIKDFLTKTMQSIKDMFTKVWNAIKSFITSVLNSIKSVITSVWNAISTFLKNIMNTIKSAITAAWNAILSSIRSIMNSIKSAITSAWNAIKSAIQSALNAIKSAVSTAFNAIKSTISSILGSIKSTVSSVFNGIKNAISSAVNGAKNAVQSAFNAMASAASSVGSKIKNGIVGAFDSLKNIASNAVQWGKDIISGLINGITSKAGDAVKKIKDVAGGIASGFKSALGIKSPSRLFKAFGGFIGQGLAIGMEKTANLVSKASDVMLGAIGTPDPVPLPEFDPTPGGPGGPPMPNQPLPSGGGFGAGAVAAATDGVTIQNARFDINVEKLQTDEDINKMRRAIQTVVSDDLFGMAVRNV